MNKQDIESLARGRYGLLTPKEQVAKAIELIYEGRGLDRQIGEALLEMDY